MDENEKDEEEITVSRRHKIRMNRIFREHGGMRWIPYPEVDNLFEKIRSKIVRRSLLKKKNEHKNEHEK